MKPRSRLILAAVVVLVLAAVAGAIYLWPSSDLAKAVASLTGLGLFGIIARIKGGARAPSGTDIGSLSVGAQSRIDAVKSATVAASLSDARRLSEANTLGEAVRGGGKKGG